MKSRVLMVHFICGRCGKVHMEPMDKQRMERGNDIYLYAVPDGWKREEISTPLLCDECNEKLQKFLEGDE